MLKLTNLTKSFGSNLAVDGLSLEIHPGEIFGLLGPNGAGKSTTLHMAVGLLAPDQGTVELRGKGSPHDRRVRSLIGMAPQSLALYEDLSGEENLTFFGRLQSLSGSPLRQRVDWALDFVDLSDRRKDPVGSYSGGMKRRLNLAAAVIHRPSLLLLDEPTVGVDPQSRHSIFEKVLKLRDEGCTVVYTTHYMEEAQKLCDRVGIIDRGRLLALDSVNQLIAEHGGKSLVRAERAEGETQLETSQPLVELERLLKEGGLLRLSVERPNLETVFLNLTGRTLRD